MTMCLDVAGHLSRARDVLPGRFQPYVQAYEVLHFLNISQIVLSIFPIFFMKYCHNSTSATMQHQAQL